MNAIEEHRFVVKSNQLIEARYRLGLQESRVILWLLQQIDFEDENFKSYKLDIKEFATLAELKTKGQYGQLREITKNLTKRVFDIYDHEKKTLLQISWLSAAFYHLNKGYVLLEFSPYLKPHLLQLKGQFTKFEVTDLLQLKSIYSVRIFELLKQYESIGKRKISVDDLRSYCGIKQGEYRNYNGIKLYVLERAAAEINAKTEYEVDYREIKESRKIIEIEWSIKRKTHFEKSQEEKALIIQKELRSGNAIIQELLEYGFTLPHSRRLVKSSDHETLVNAIKSVDIQVERGKAKNPKAMLIKAIHVAACTYKSAGLHLSDKTGSRKVTL